MQQIRLTGITGAVFIAAALGVAEVSATTWQVPGNGSGVCSIVDPNCDTIQQAVTAATDYDSIFIGDGTFSGAGNFAIVLTKSLGIYGESRETTLLQPDAGSFGFSIRADDVTISDLSIEGGATGINFQSAPSDNAQISGIDFIGNTSRGVDIAVAGADTVTNVRIDDCTFTSVGTGVRMSSNSQVDGLTILNSTFTSNNYAIYQANDGNTSTLAYLSISACEFINNTFYAIYAEEMRDATITGSTFINNRVAFQLLKIYTAASAASNIKITDNHFSAHTFSTLNLEVTNSGLESPITIADNTIELDVATLAFNAAGIFVGLGHAHTHAPVYVTDNTITLAGSFGSATAAFGVRVRRNGPVFISGNTLDGGNVGGAGNAPATSGLYIEANSSAGAMPATATVEATCNSLSGFRNGVSVFDSAGLAYGGLAAGATVTLSRNDITGNSDFGVINGAGSETVDARKNWWGCAAGADHPGCDDVSGPVDVSGPATTSEPCLNQCPTAPGGCRSAAKSILVFKAKPDIAKNKLTWKWNKGEATTQGDFADPRTSANYSLCVYAGTSAALVGESLVPADANKWKAISSKGYKYKDKTVSVSGITTAVLKGGILGKAKTLVKGKGPGLPLLPLPLEAPVTVQLRNNETGICWGADYASGQIAKNQVGFLKAKVK